jgi:hypothetical protein
MSLTFNEASHRYRLDSKHVTGVTTILGKGVPKPALTRWSAKVVAEYVADNEDAVAGLRAMGRGPMVGALSQTPWQKRDDAGVRGTEVHAIAEEIVNGREVDVPERLMAYVDDYVRFLDTWHVEPIVTEVSVANREQWYAGRPDFIGRIGGIFGGQVTCLDWKTSKGVYGETALQTAAYSRAEFYVASNEDQTEHPLPDVERLGVVHITPEGTQVYDLGDPDEHYKTFKHIKFIADRLTALNDLTKVAAPEPTQGAAA